MAKKNKFPKKEEIQKEKYRLHPEVKKTIVLVTFLGLTIIFIISALGKGGSLGLFIYKSLSNLFSLGYYLLPLIFFLIAFSLVGKVGRNFAFGFTLLSGFVFLISSLGFFEIIIPGSGGFLGSIIGNLKTPFGLINALVISLMLMVISFLIMINRPLKLPKFKKGQEKTSQPVISQIPESEPLKEKEEKKLVEEASLKIKEEKLKIAEEKIKVSKVAKDYIFPPISLLNLEVEKPTVGDLRANANIIKRTLESFGVTVEMGEISVGPTITRYTLKPAEGVKLSRITALSQDLALALAAHPIRIEAPIPGKSLVGIEVPNKIGALVRLGSLLRYPEFQKSGFLTFALGRDVSGEPVFADISKMPHLLIAGATGSGKSITIHSLIISLLYKNSPATLRLVLVDPKKVELSVYNDLPHLISPVITDNKKALGALRWVIQEMENRYQKLLEAGARDIKTFNQKSSKPLPYILIIVDELADLMISFGREVEGAIIRLAQMSRATGIHLVFSTQRPSVEVITGLIKANITSRIALQVPSQIDSRTILDFAGAEKLLGRGDLLFISPELSKPKRIQGAFVSEEEVKKVVDFIKAKNKMVTEEIVFESVEKISNGNDLEKYLDFEEFSEKEEDPLYEEAVKIVLAAKKASASLLQRRLKIGYARAARLLDIMEEKGIVGPAEGSKPREVLIKNL